MCRKWHVHIATASLLTMCGVLTVEADSRPSRCSDFQHLTAEKAESSDAYIQGVSQCVAEGDYRSALKLAETFRTSSANNQDQLLQAMSVEAAVYSYMDLLPQSLEILRRIINERGNTASPDRLYVAYNNSADILLRLNRLEEAEAAVKQAISIAEQTGIVADQATASGTFGQIAIRQKRYEEAKMAIDRCIELGKDLHNSLLIVDCTHNLAHWHLAKEQWQQALSIADETNKLADALKYKAILPKTLLLKAIAEKRLGQIPQSVRTANRGLAVARERGEIQSSLDLLAFLQEHWFESNQIMPARDAGVEIQRLNSLLFDQKLANMLAAERTHYELDSKEQEITRLRQQNELEQASAEAAKAQRTAVISISLFVLAIFAIGYSRWMHKRDLDRAEAANQELKRLNELKDQFLANTSHELRTPLNGIIGLSDIILVEDRERLSSEAQDNLRMIRDCGNQLSQLVDDILDFSRLRAEKLVLNKQPMQLADAIDDVVKLLRPLATAKGLNLSSRVAADLPSISADGDRIRQVLHNLIGNAIKFTEQGSVTVDADRHGDQLRVQIRDTGVGIPADRLERIFEPFEQADGSSGRRYGGAGLGLSIARQLVVAHGGTLTVLSEPGRGSVFSFNFPLA